VQTNKNTYECFSHSDYLLFLKKNNVKLRQLYTMHSVRTALPRKP
jgi:hypothetical protein